VSSLVRLLIRIKLHRDVFGVYSKVDTLYHSQNGKIEGTTLEECDTTQRNVSVVVYTSYAISASIKVAVSSFDPKDGDVRTQAATAVNQHAAANHSIIRPVD
jgi:hypothetical protein